MFMSCRPVMALTMSSIAAGLVTSVAHVRAAEPTAFALVVRNIAKSDTLKLPDGSGLFAPIAPGLYVVLEGGTQLFRSGRPAPRELESLAEDGDASSLLEVVKKTPGFRAAGMFVPGQPFTIKAMPGDRLGFASMFVQSNDKFYATKPEGIDLFERTNPLAGDLTSKVILWDAGTERDEPPGTGPNQAPRQSGANIGVNENGVVRPADDGFIYPPVSNVLQFTVLPQQRSGSASGS